MANRDAHAVWEITLGCNLGCRHCGSRAGKPRTNELSTDEALDLIRQLAEVGIREVSLIGGEAYLRGDWLHLVREIRRRGMSCSMVTGGYGISPKLARRMADAGLEQCSVSVDGLQSTHDGLRGREGSWKACLDAMKALTDVGIYTSCNTQINRLTSPELPEIYRVLRDAGMRSWQLALTVPMGNAADHPEILVQPYDLLDIFPVLSELKQQADSDGVLLALGNNVGYFGPYDRILSTVNGQWQAWDGCHAGVTGLGIEADGTIKGCPSLPTSAYRGGNIRDQTLAEIVKLSPELNFNLDATVDHLWGFCRECEHATLCRGGCSWTAHTFFGRRGNNPYCHHRAIVMAQRGLRERLQLTSPAVGLPFDHGEFELTVEPWPSSRSRLRPASLFGAGQNDI